MNNQANPILSDEQGKTDLKKFLDMTDAANMMKGIRQEVDSQLSFEDQKRDAIKRIIEAARARGDNDLTEADVASGVEASLQGLYTFKEPKRNLSTSFAEMYVNRGVIAKKAAITGFVAAMAVTAYFGITGIASSVKNARLNAQEKEVETAVESSLRDEKDLQNQLQSLKSSPTREHLPRGDLLELEALALSANSNLQNTSSFFNKYCPAESTKDNITRENYPDVKRELANNIQAYLGAAKADIEKGNGIIKTQSELISVRQGLDALLEQVKATRPLPVFLGRAQDDYTAGITAVNNRQLAEAQGYEGKLRTLKQESVDFTDLAGRVDTAYTKIKADAKEKTALDQGERLYSDATTAVQVADVSRLRNAVDGLQQLDNLLNEDAEYIIVDGDRRIPNANQDMYRYYFIIEKRDKNTGRVLPQEITNEETGSRVTANRVGFRVAEGRRDAAMPKVYADVGKDKRDNGVIDNNKFAVKRRGYLNEQVLMMDGGKPAEVMGKYPY